MIQGNVDLIGWQIEGWAGCNEQSDCCDINVFADGCLVKTGKADLPRTDVMEAHGLLNVGFSINMSGIDGLTGKKINIVARSQTAEATIGEFPFELGSKVEIGQEGYLFLRNDSNFTDQYLSGEKYYSDAEAFNTAAILRNRELLLHNAGIDIVQAILPEKSDVLSHLRREPYDLSSDRFVHKVSRSMKALGAENFSFLRDFIAQDSLLPKMFSKTDTHLTDFGVDLTVLHLLDRIMPDVRRVVRIYEEREFIGDLALTLQDPSAREIIQCRVNRPGVNIVDDTEALVSENGRLTGSRITFTNNAPLIDCSVMIVGTSTARGFLYSMADIFRRGVMVWGLNFDYSEILAMRPRLVFFVATERILSPSILR